MRGVGHVPFARNIPGESNPFFGPNCAWNYDGAQFVHNNVTVVSENLNGATHLVYSQDMLYYLVLLHGTRVKTMIIKSNSWSLFNS